MFENVKNKHLAPSEWTKFAKSEGINVGSVWIVDDPKIDRTFLDHKTNDIFVNVKGLDRFLPSYQKFLQYWGADPNITTDELVLLKYFQMLGRIKAGSSGDYNIEKKEDEERRIKNTPLDIVIREIQNDPIQREAWYYAIRQIKEPQVSKLLEAYKSWRARLILLPHLRDRIALAKDAEGELLTKCADESKETEKNNNFFVYHFLHRTIAYGESIEMLAGKGFYHEAILVARTVLEGSINFEYYKGHHDIADKWRLFAIYEDGKKAANTFSLYAKHRWLEDYERRYGKKLIDRAEKEFAFNYLPKETRTFSKKNAS